MSLTYPNQGIVPDGITFTPSTVSGPVFPNVYGTINADGTVVSGSLYNVSSSSKTGTGAYSIIFEDELSNSTYSSIATTWTGNRVCSIGTPSTSGCTFVTGNTSTTEDNKFSFIIFGG